MQRGDTLNRGFSLVGKQEGMNSGALSTEDALAVRALSILFGVAAEAARAKVAGLQAQLGAGHGVVEAQGAGQLFTDLIGGPCEGFTGSPVLLASMYRGTWFKGCRVYRT